MNQDPDLLLARLLATPERPPDDLFVLKVRNAVAAEERLREARRATWQRLAIELGGAMTAILAFVLLAGGAPELGEDVIAPTGPAAAGILLLVLWLAVTARAGSAAD